MSSYAYQVFVDSTGVGHAFIALYGPDGQVMVKGFYPANGGSSSSGQNVLSVANFGDSILNPSLNRPRGKSVKAGASRRCDKQQIEFDILSPKLPVTHSANPSPTSSPPPPT